MQADIPPRVRKALIALALAYRAATDQLARLINWHDPNTCSSPSRGEARDGAAGPGGGLSRQGPTPKTKAP
jgi:hypothetical protein